MQNFTYFRQIYQECYKQTIKLTYGYTQTTVVFVRTTQQII